VRRLRVAVVGCGTIGKRVVDAVRSQPDMELAGIGVRSVSPALLAAVSGGASVFCTEEPRRAELQALGLGLEGGLRELLERSDAVVDCTPSRRGASRRDLYRAAGLPAVFCGGERHEDIGLTFSTLANYEAALGQPAARVASCNTTGLVRLLAGLQPRFEVVRGHAVLVRCATDPDKAAKGLVNGATVTPGISHHAHDLALLLPGMQITTQAILAPMNQGHVALLHLELARPADRAAVVDWLGGAPRVLLVDEPASTTGLRLAHSVLDRPRGDVPELMVWLGSVVVEGGRLTLAVAIHMEAVVIPETIDCLRALTGAEPDRNRCVRRTDEALGIAQRPGRRGRGAEAGEPPAPAPAPEPAAASRNGLQPAGKASLLRQRLAGDRLVRVGGAHDGLSARLIERHGFDAVWASGLGISATHAVPDASILSMADFLAAATAMNHATALPVIADCDTGFGSVGTVARMVRLYEQAGIAGLCMEDKQFPKRNSFLDGHMLAEVGEFAAKIEVAKRTQCDPDFVVIARVESLIAGAGLADALDRATAYARAGADAILVHSKAPTPDEVLQFGRAWRGRAPTVPLAVVPTTYPEVRGDQLEAAGIRVVVYANQALRAAISAMNAALSAMAASGSGLAGEVDLADLEDVFGLIGTSELALLERWFDERVEAARALATRE
jgi:phosphoenolpyruvate phosphomutase